MQIGAIFPQTEIGPDPAAIRDYVQAVEGMEFDYLFIADHVLGADPDAPRARAGQLLYAPQRHSRVADDAGVHRRHHYDKIRLITGILILPQRQTALVAKQAVRDRRAERRTAHAGHWRRLEPRGV